MSRIETLQTLDWNAYAGGFPSHYDPTASQQHLQNNNNATAPDPICSASNPVVSRTLPPVAQQLHHYPPPSSANYERMNTRSRTMRRPNSALAPLQKPFSPVGGVSQSFAAPLRPQSLQEFQEAIRKLATDDPQIEERIRVLTSHVAPDVYEVIEPIRRQCGGARQFVETILRLKHCSVRQGFGMSIEDFKSKLTMELSVSGKTIDDIMDDLLLELGPHAEAAVREKFLTRSSTESFLSSLDTIELPSGKTIAFSRPYLSMVIDCLCEMDSMVPKTPMFDLIQNDITPKIRFILAEWLFDVSVRFKFCPETIFLALALTDRYMMVHRVARSEAQLVGVAALVLAAKYEEVYPPEIKDYVYMSANAFTAGDIVRMERQLFVRLQFGVTVATINAVATSLLAEQDPTPCELQGKLVHYMSLILAVSTHLGQHSQAQLAAAVVYVSRLWCGIPTQAPSVHVQKLLPVVVNSLLAVNPSARQGATVYNYFSQPAQLQVSSLAIPATVLTFASDDSAGFVSSPTSAPSIL